MADPLPFHLLPDGAALDGAGRLQLHGHDVEALAAAHGTPLFVYDEDHLRARCREALDAFGEGVAYASKAFLCKAMARLVHEEGLMLDVASGGELHVVLSAGVPADRCVLHGNNKSSAELELAMRAGVRRIVVDSFDELDRIDALVASGLHPPEVLIRVTPGVEAHTHEFVQTGQDDSKFGFGLASGAAIEALARAREAASVRLRGIHVHIGSQVFSVDNFAKALDVVAPLARSVDLEELCVGGGLGVAYVEGEDAPTITEWAHAVIDVCRSAGVESRITAEPGRAIAAQAAMTLYTVGTIKVLPGIRTYVSVDGGMSDNPRPVLYGSGYETFVPARADAERPDPVRLVGKHCESGDLLVREGWVPSDLSVGDVIATPVTGAYGYSMASNYNRLPRPAVLFVGSGGVREVVRRETFEDLVRLDTCGVPCTLPSTPAGPVGSQPGGGAGAEVPV
jgi:diaminopimelate decarboxylase